VRAFRVEPAEQRQQGRRGCHDHERQAYACQDDPPKGSHGAQVDVTWGAG
jgi:hypothetical protein